MALPEFTLRQLLEAGVHFGHQTQRWNPLMGEFIYGARNGIHIMDLTQTVPMLDAALNAIRETVARGRAYPVCGHKTPSGSADIRSRREMRTILYEPPLVGRHADQLANGFTINQAAYKY